MSLTPEELREMYADIKVIKSNCVRCSECQKLHDSRLSKLERDVVILKEDKRLTGWICSAIGAVIAWLLTTAISFFRG